MFIAFVALVALLFIGLVTRTYVRRWLNDRGSVDPQASQRARSIRAQHDVQPLRGPLPPPPPPPGGNVG